MDARIEFLEERVKLRPKSFLEEAELAGLYLQKGKLRQDPQKLAKAKDWADHSLAEFPNNAARVVLADLLQMEHRFQESLAILAQVLREEAGSGEARALAVRVLLAQGQPEQAQQVLDPVAQQPIFAYRFLQAQILEASGDKDRAAEVYEEALRRERQVQSPSESARLRAVWGRMELERGNLQQAERLLRAAKAIPVEIPLVEMQRAKLAVAHKKWKEAAEILRNGYALYQDPLFLIELAHVLDAQGQANQAKENYQIAAGLLRKDPFGHERDLALALLKLDAKANRAEIIELMTRELARRRDPATLAVWAQVREHLGPLPEPKPLTTGDSFSEGAPRVPAAAAALSGAVAPIPTSTPR